MWAVSRGGVTAQLLREGEFLILHNELNVGMERELWDGLGWPWLSVTSDMTRGILSRWARTCRLEWGAKTCHGGHSNDTWTIAEHWYWVRVLGGQVPLLETMRHTKCSPQPRQTQRRVDNRTETNRKGEISLGFLTKYYVLQPGGLVWFMSPWRRS